MLRYTVLGIIAIFLYVAPSSIKHSSASTLAYDCNIQSRISFEQCDNLVKIYVNTSGENWDNNTNWLTNDDPCSWFGIVCWGDMVARIYLGNNNLSGKLPFLYGLPYLRTVALYDNANLTGTISHFVSLQYLEQITAFRTGLNGYLPNFARMENLSEVVIFSNLFSGPLPDVSRLTRLDISNSSSENLCLSESLDYSVHQEETSNLMVCESITSDDFDGFIDVTDIGLIPNDGIYDHFALQNFIDTVDLTTTSLSPYINNVTLYFPDGIYDFDESVKITKYNRFKILGQSHNTIIKKSPNFGNNSNGRINSSTDGALFHFHAGKYLTIEMITFEGQTTDYDTLYSWWDNGISVTSSRQTNILNNVFRHFGGSATHITTHDDDPLAINSHTILISGNTFTNIRQTSTTSENGGSESIYFVDNYGYNIKGSFKFSSRKLGANNLIVAKNTVVAGKVSNSFDDTNNGFEIAGYTDVSITGNTITDGYNNGITIRNAQLTDVDDAFPWGNIYIANNHIANFKRGIYVSNLEHVTTGNLYPAHNVLAINNTISQLWSEPHNPAIHYVGSEFKVSRIQNNTIVGDHPIYYPQEGVILKGNVNQSP